MNTDSQLKASFDALRGRICNFVEVITEDVNRLDPACKLVKELTYQTQAEVQSLFDAPTGVVAIPDGMTEAVARELMRKWLANKARA